MGQEQAERALELGLSYSAIQKIQLSTSSAGNLLSVPQRNKIREHKLELLFWSMNICIKQ